MNSKLISAGRFLVAVVVLALGVFGYVCFERTLVVWWWPVAVSAFVVLLSVPLFYNRWQWLTEHPVLSTYCAMCMSSD